ncbi:M24 family metallopeptidase [Candidatus Margulisiibacteriota bacterium]
MSLKKKISCIKQAIVIGSKVFEDIIRYIKPGVTENSVAKLIRKKIKAYGGDGPAFKVIVASGRRSSMIHGFASMKKIRKGEQVLLDYGVKYRGYKCDISRTIFIIKASKRQRKIYKIVLKAQNKAAQKLYEGADCDVIDNHARKIITLANYGKNFPHSTGHGLSKKIHDAPKIGSKSTQKLKAGDIVTIEPGIYIRGWGGVRIEDDYLITKNGSICLTKNIPKNTPLVV